jgi:hypothetical protein
MSNVVHATLANTASDRELHLPGFSPATYAALLLVAGMVAGDVAFQVDKKQYWYYDGTNWRILGRFLTTSGALGSLAGIQPGDFAYLTDTNQMAWYNGTAWSYLP